MPSILSKGGKTGEKAQTTRHFVRFFRGSYDRGTQPWGIPIGSGKGHLHLSELYRDRVIAPEIRI